ncbi:MAG TPA: PQQ-binding-like beta-propeller repeat protein [Nocardioides sp.]|nr:PQQ-binding-like beta-propeller repeat protein [Nocardioides sp.]
MRLGRGTALCAAVLLLVTGCSSEGGDPQEAGGAPTTGASAPGSPDPTAPPEAIGVQRVVDPLTPGAVDVLRVLPKPPYKSEYGQAEVKAVFTDELAVFGDTRGNLWAVDRETGKPRWHVPMRSSLPDGDTVCSLTVPAPDSTVVVANHGGGWLCGAFTVYDLETGKVTLQYESIPTTGREVGFRLSSNSGLFRLGESTYWTDGDDRLRRIDPDGDSSVVGNPLLLAPKYDGWNLTSFQVLPGSEVFVARVLPPSKGYDPKTFGKTGDRGDLIGFRFDDEDRLELAWQQPVAKLMAASPGHAPGSFGMQDELPGLVSDVVHRGGGKYFRQRMIDAESGELLGPGVLASFAGMKKGGQGLPGFAEEYGPEQSLVVGTDAVLTPYEVPERNGHTSLVRYDMTTGTPVWRWQLPGAMRSDFPPNIGVLGVTPDRSAVYVYTSMDYDNEIRELDYETGRQRHSWQLPQQQSYAFELDFAPTYLDGDQVLQVNSHAYEREKDLAALLNVGR